MRLSVGRAADVSCIIVIVIIIAIISGSMAHSKTAQYIVALFAPRTGQDKTRQREVTDAGTTVPLSPHLQCRYSDDNIHFIQLKTLIDLRFRG